MGESRSVEAAHIGPLDVYVGFVALYSIVLLLVGIFVTLSPEEERLFSIADLALCALFLFDLAVRYRKAPDKLRFWKWGWIDLLASVPLFPFLRWGRSIRLFRVLQLLRAVEGVRMLHGHVFAGKRVSAPVLAFFLFYTIMMICAPAILFAESGDPEANIKTAGGAIWWVFETISTVGYGDFYPVTTMGRCIGVMTMVFGVGMFGAITASVLSLLHIDNSSGSADSEALRAENERLKAALAAGAAPDSAPKNGNGCNLAGNH